MCLRALHASCVSPLLRPEYAQSLRVNLHAEVRASGNPPRRDGECVLWAVNYRARICDVDRPWLVVALLHLLS